MIPFLLGSYTSITLVSLWALARITGPRKPSHWLAITIAAAGWPITLMLIRTV